MRLIINLSTVKVYIEDDCESTPGISRQITRFNSDCRQQIYEKVANYVFSARSYSLTELYEWIDRILAENNFERNNIIKPLESDYGIEMEIRSKD